MPTAQDILDAALLSNLAYSLQPNVDQSGGWSVLSRTQLDPDGALGLTQAKWDDDATDTDNSQYLYDIQNAQGIVATKDHTLAISFHGSENWSDYLADLNGGLNSFLSQYALFANLLTAAEAYARNPLNGITEVLITGHSLGAAMADIYMAHNHVTDLNLVGVTFGSPGDPRILNGGVRDVRIIDIQHSGDGVVNATEFVFGAPNQFQGGQVTVDLRNV